MISSFVSLVVVILFVASVGAKFGPDSSVCKIDDFTTRARQSGGPTKPILPPQWTVRIEADDKENNYTQDIHEFYDGPGNKGAVFQYVGGTSVQMIFLYATNELITLQFDSSGNPPRCHVEDLAKSQSKNIFGLSVYANGTEHIFSANQALRFGGHIPEVFLGQQVARDGVTVNVWESCLYFDTLDGTFLLRWYFTANNTWTSAINKVVPTELKLTGKIHVNRTHVVPINRNYIFTDFRPELFYGPVGAFETPVGTYCYNRVSTQTLRNVTNRFSFSAEIFEPETNVISWIKENYDYDLNLVRYDYTADPGSGSLYGYNKLIRVHDFSTGVAYIIDPELGNCSMSPISVLGFDAESLNGGKIRMRTSKEFLDFDKVQYQYSGQRLVRGITCDVWVALRNDYPPGFSSPQTTFEWYFASQEWMQKMDKKVAFMVPIMLQVTSINPPMNIIYNIYDYNEGDPNIWATDISSCFDQDHRKFFQLAFPGEYSNAIAEDVTYFKAEFLQSVAAITGVSPLRISNIEVDTSRADVVVTFTLLDKAPIKGDSVQSGFTEPSLSKAANIISSQVKSNNFVVLVDSKKFPTIKDSKLTAKQFSLKSWFVDEINGTTDYSQGPWSVPVSMQSHQHSTPGIARKPTSKQGISRIPTSKQGISRIPTSKQGISRIPTSKQGIARIPTSKQGIALIPTSTPAIARISTSNPSPVGTSTSRSTISKKDGLGENDSTVIIAVTTVLGIVLIVLIGAVLFYKIRKMSLTVQSSAVNELNLNMMKTYKEDSDRL